MKHNTEIVTHDGVEYVVSYSYEIEDARYEELGNIASFVPATSNVYIYAVLANILDDVVGVLNSLNEKQIELLISKLTYQ